MTRRDAYLSLERISHKKADQIPLIVLKIYKVEYAAILYLYREDGRVVMACGQFTWFNQQYWSMLT